MTLDKYDSRQIKRMKFCKCNYNNNQMNKNSALDVP